MVTPVPSLKAHVYLNTSEWAPSFGPRSARCRSGTISGAIYLERKWERIKGGAVGLHGARAVSFTEKLNKIAFRFTSTCQIQKLWQQGAPPSPPLCTCPAPGLIASHPPIRSASIGARARVETNHRRFYSSLRDHELSTPASPHPIWSPLLYYNNPLISSLRSAVRSNYRRAADTLSCAQTTKGSLLLLHLSSSPLLMGFFFFRSLSRAAKEPSMPNLTWKPQVSISAYPNGVLKTRSSQHCGG